MAPHVNVFEVLLSCDSRSQEDMFEHHLCQQAAPSKALGAVRLACRAARTLVDGYARALSVAFVRSPEDAPVVPLDTWVPGVTRLDGALGGLAARWPRVDALHMRVRNTGKESSYDMCCMMLQQLGSAFLRHAEGGTQRLAQLQLSFERPASLTFPLFRALANACPNLHTLAISGPGVALSNEDMIMHYISRQPRLSDLTIPDHAGLPHLGLLAGQLTRLVLADPGRTEQDAPGLRTAQALIPGPKMVALRGLKRLTHLAVMAPAYTQALLARPLPSLRQLDLHDTSLTYTDAGGGRQLDALALRECTLASLPTAAMSARGTTTGPHRPRLLRIHDISISAVYPPDRAARERFAETLDAFGAVEVGGFSLGLRGSTAAGVDAALQALALVRATMRAHGQQGATPLSLELEGPFGNGAVHLEHEMHSGQAAAGGAAGELPLADLLLPYAYTAAGTFRHLLLVSVGFSACAKTNDPDDNDFGCWGRRVFRDWDVSRHGVPVQRYRDRLKVALEWELPEEIAEWLEESVSVHAPYAQVEALHPVLPGVALELATPEAAAAAARWLRAASASFEGFKVLVVPTQQLATKQWLAHAPLEALRTYLEHGCGDAEAKLRRAAEGWKALVDWADSFQGPDRWKGRMPPPVKMERSMPPWHALAQRVQQAQQAQQHMGGMGGVPTQQERKGGRSVRQQGGAGGRSQQQQGAGPGGVPKQQQGATAGGRPERQGAAATGRAKQQRRA